MVLQCAFGVALGVSVAAVWADVAFEDCKAIDRCRVVCS